MAPNAARVVRGSDLRRDGTLAPADESVGWALVPRERQLSVGDILIRRVFSASNLGGLAAVEVADSDLPAVASETVVTLRAKNALTDSERILILGYLRSGLARDLTAASADGGVHLTQATLRELHIPQPDEPLHRRYRRSFPCSRPVRAMALSRHEACSIRYSAMTVPHRNPDPDRRRWQDSSPEELTSRRSAGRCWLHLPDTDSPSPSRTDGAQWRRQSALARFKEALEAILAAAEVLMCYAANVGLAIAHHTSIDIGAMKTISSKLAPGQTGLGSRGLDHSSSRVPRQQSGPGTSLPETRLRNSRPFWPTRTQTLPMQQLKARRDDELHIYAWPDPGSLLACSGKLPDGSDHPLPRRELPGQRGLLLIHVTAFHWDTFQRLGTVSYRELTGDHPVVPTRTIIHGDPEIEVGSLYVIDGQNRMHLLRPFLTGKDCPKCGGMVNIPH